MKMFKFDLQLFGGGGKGGSSTTVENKMSDEQRQQNAKANQITNTLVSGATNIGNQWSNGVNSNAYSNIFNQAQGYTNQGLGNIYNSASGVINPNYQQNMEDSIRMGVNATVGNAVNNLANRGVINGSVSNKALNDISSNVSNTMAQNYNNNLTTQAQLGNNLIANATAGYNPYNALLGQVGTASGLVNGSASLYGGTGSRTQTQGGGSFFDTLGSIGMGLATGWAGKQMGLGK